MSSGGEEDFDAGDFRTDDQIRYDAMCEQARQVTEQARQVTELVKTLLERSPYGQTQTVIHKTQGMGAWGAASVVACFATWIALIVLALWESNLWAWKDIHDHRISVLEAKTK